MLDQYSLQIAVAVFFISLLISRFMVLNAVKKLSDEDKSKLLSANLINNSQTRMLLLFAGLGVYYFAVTKFPEYAKELVIAFALIFITVRFVNFINTRKKLLTLDLPDPYIAAFTNSSTIYNAGILAFFFLLIKNYL